MISIKYLELSLDVIHSAKCLFPNVLSVLVLHLLSEINSKSNSFLSLTKFIISSLNSASFQNSLVKNFPPFLFNVRSSSFIYYSCIVFRRSVNELCSWFTKLLRRLGLAYVSLSAKQLRRLAKPLRESLSNSSLYPTLCIYSTQHCACSHCYTPSIS